MGFWFERQQFIFQCVGFHSYYPLLTLPLRLTRGVPRPLVWFIHSVQAVSNNRPQKKKKKILQPYKTRLAFLHGDSDSPVLHNDFERVLYVYVIFKWQAHKLISSWATVCTDMFKPSIIIFALRYRVYCGTFSFFLSFFFQHHNPYPSIQPAIFYKRLNSPGVSSVLHCARLCNTNRGQCRNSYRCGLSFWRQPQPVCPLRHTKEQGGIDLHTSGVSFKILFKHS